MFPFQLLMQTLTSLQVTILVRMLHLFIPHTASEDVAYYLHRVQRRAILVMLGQVIPRNWSFQWQLRTWNYLGHVLRKPEQHSAKQALRRLHDAQRPKRWACHIAYNLGETFDTQ